MPVVSGTPKQIALNFTGIVLFSLNAAHRISEASAVSGLNRSADRWQEPVEDAARGQDREIIADKRQGVVSTTVAVVDRECSDLDCVSSNEFARIACQSSSERI